MLRGAVRESAEGGFALPVGVPALLPFLKLTPFLAKQLDPDVLGRVAVKVVLCSLCGYCIRSLPALPALIKDCSQNVCSFQ